jgi:hypothetical protein
MSGSLIACGYFQLRSGKCFLCNVALCVDLGFCSVCSGQVVSPCSQLNVLAPQRQEFAPGPPFPRLIPVHSTGPLEIQRLQPDAFRRALRVGFFPSYCQLPGRLLSPPRIPIPGCKSAD